MSDFSTYHHLGQGEQDPSNPNRSTQPAPPQFSPPIAGQPYQQGAPYGAPPAPGQQYYGGQPPMPGSAQPQGSPYGAPQGQPYAQSPGFQSQENLAAQMGGMSLGPGDGHNTLRKKKKDRHAYHQVEATGSSQAFNGMPPPGTPATAFLNADPSQAQYVNPQITPAMNQFPAAAGQTFTPGIPATQAEFATRNGADAGGPPAVVQTGGHQKLSLDDLPSVPVSRDSLQQHYFSNVYPTFEKHLPPPATVSYVAFDQGNASPKFARLTLNSIPASAEGLALTGLPMGLLLQPLAPLQPGELEIPVLDFGESGPPRCRRCRAYINPFMMFRSGGNKFVCNLCTYPNDTPSEYFSALTPQGVRVDRDQRPELTRGTVEFVVPKEYWTKEPTGLRWLFVIDVTQESFNKGFIESFCEGVLAALYGGEDAERDENGEPKRVIPEGAKVGFVTYDKDIHFYNVSVSGSSVILKSNADRRSLPWIKLR